MNGHFLAEYTVSESVEEQAQTRIKVPKKYKVLLLNDDYTPMDFVVAVLKKFFGFNEEQATKIMLDVHFSGKAICGVYSKDVAETKVVQVNDYARANQHPLLCGMEPE